MSDPIQDYIDEIEGKGGMSSGKSGSATQGPTPDFLDYGTTQQSYKEATYVEQEMLKSIDNNLLKANKALADLKNRVAPPQPRTAKGVAKAVDYEKGLRDTVSFLETEKAQITAALELKKERLGTPMEVIAEEANVKAKSLEGPPVIKQSTKSKPPFLNIDVPTQQANVKLPDGRSATIKVDPNVKGSATIIGTEPAQSPQSAAKEVKKTQISEITMTTEPKVSPGGIEYRSPKSVNVPDMRIGQDPSGKPIKGKIPASQYLLERGLMTEKQIVEASRKQSADYGMQLAEEQVNQYKTEFDFETGETKKATLESTLGTKPQYTDELTDSQKKALYKSNIPYAKPTTGLGEDLGRPFPVKPPKSKGGQAAGFGDVGKLPDVKPSIFTAGPLIKGLHRTFKGKAFGFGVLPKGSIEDILGKVPGSQWSKKPEA
jgi:hypothetical protein